MKNSIGQTDEVPSALVAGSRVQRQEMEVESVSEEKNSSRFFRNTECEYFPCHEGLPEEAFNCLFCYCPLYALGRRCGGNFRYTEKGIKSCVDCTFPHRRENAEQVMARFPEIARVVRRMDEEES